ncbi:hypothetical protein [Borreliella afzelii]|uniref:Uncharacterized protein n=1 Tax=Borreliella afzelii TaxID=29518 RepID=A0A1L4DGH8_BORAF|nr:hypothetical protein BLA32_05335 [Borreliella afzelii]
MSRIDEIDKDINVIKYKSSFIENIKRIIVVSIEVVEKITGSIYDYFTNDIGAIYYVWYDNLNTSLKELLEKLSTTREDLKATLNEGNQKYTESGKKPILKEHARASKIESNLDKLKSELKRVKEYLKDKSNFEKIKEYIANSANG